MTIRSVYLILAILGTVLPYSQFVPFLLQYGLDLPLFLEQLFANDISAFFGLDVVISAIVLLFFISSEGKRLRLQRLWLPVIATLTIGVSCGLPLFLYMRAGEVESFRG